MVIRAALGSSRKSRRATRSLPPTARRAPAAALAPLPLHIPHRLRGRRRGAERGHALAVRPLKPRDHAPPPPVNAEYHFGQANVSLAPHELARHTILRSRLGDTQAERQLAATGPADSGPGTARQDLQNTRRKHSMTTTTAPRTGYAPVNGLNMYYEIHGEGQPLLLLHGAFSAIGTSFGKLLPGLSEGRQVIGVELQAHGRTADIDRPLDLELLAEDTAAFLRYLNIAQADVFGYSNGAAVALRLTVRHPNLVRKQVLASI